MSRLIVIEGLDGCGKSTQLELLKSRFPRFGYITFPYYETESGRIIKKYLSGEYREENSEISAYSASVMYAVDRYTSFKTHWEELYKSGTPLISARYVSSNAVYQMTKLEKSEWDSYLGWLFDLEYKKLGMPRPDMTVFLDMPVEVSQKLLSERYGGDESKKDIHESNVEFLKSCREAAIYVGEKQGWSIVPCSENNEPRSIEDINSELCGLISRFA